MKAAYIFILWFLFLNLNFFHSSAGTTLGQTFQQKPVTNLTTIDSKGAKALLAQQPKVIILDVRTPPEFAGGHLKNALNLDYNQPDFANRLAQLDKNRPYLVYCAVGGRSSKAARLMQQMGFKQIINVSEGYTSLKKAGVAVVQ